MRNLKYTKQVKCDCCGKITYKYPYELKQNKGNYCSIQCFHNSRIKQYVPNVKCSFCGKDFFRAKRFIRRCMAKTGKFFCSKSCQISYYKQHGRLVPLTKEGFEKWQAGKNRVLKTITIIKNQKNKIVVNNRPTCKTCGIKLSYKNKTGYCRKHMVYSMEYKQRLSETAKRLMREGRIKPWTKRPILSYPERFFKKVLDINKINYDGVNYPIPKTALGINTSGCYFLDFKIGNIDLEIDGKQHKTHDRIINDINRDKILGENGFYVYRIPWKSINTNSGKEYIKTEIKKLLDFINQNKQTRV